MARRWSTGLHIPGLDSHKWSRFTTCYFYGQKVEHREGMIWMCYEYLCTTDVASRGSSLVDTWSINVRESSEMDKKFLVSRMKNIYTWILVTSDDSLLADAHCFPLNIQHDVNTIILAWPPDPCSDVWNEEGGASSSGSEIHRWASLANDFFTKVYNDVTQLKCSKTVSRGTIFLTTFSRYRHLQC